MLSKKSMSPFLALLALGLSGAAQADPGAGCATPEDQAVVRHYYEHIRKAAPPPIPGRLYRMKEARVVSALPPSQAYGVRSSRTLFEEVWKSIDTWGAETRIGLVFTSGGTHAWNFPSKVPITQDSTSEIMYDMYADGGKGVHGHITQADVDSIWALQLPTAEPDKFTRILSFYDKAGDLIVGLYVSEGTKPFDARAVEGFERTRALLQTRPRLCAAG